MTPEVIAAILTRVAEGESVRSIARDPEMPAMSTIFKYLAQDTAFAEQYARACEMRADAKFEEMFEIADDGSNDWMEKSYGENSPPGWQLNGEHVQRSRLRVDTLKWALARMNPKKYGDKLDLNHGGTVGLNVSKIESVIVDPVEQLANSEDTGAIK